jgi:ribosomal protein S18 acetylase RimI-like enzyme
MITHYDAFPLCLDVVIRACREDDLPALEWFGLFARDRSLIRSVFDQHRRGDAIMLVAEANGAPSGQLWVALEERHGLRVGVIWALRVMPCLQRLGVGARLIGAAESLLLERGFERVELCVESDNPPARRLYEKLGYRFVADSKSRSVFGKDIRVPCRVAAGSL